MTELVLAGVWRVEEIQLDLKFGKTTDRLLQLQTHQTAALAKDNAQKTRQIRDLSKQLADLLDTPVTVDQSSFLEREILPRTRKHHLPDSLVAAQWALESARGENFASNNYFGIGPGWYFPTLDAAMETYYITIKNILAHKGYDLSKMTSAKEILTKLQEGSYRYEGDEPDPTTYIRSIMATPEWSRYSK